jgi:mono/diheme cytochrome c family protein
MRTILMTISMAALSCAAANAADAAAGKTVYDTSCKSCHGADGTPNAAVAKMMKADMKDLKSADVQGLSDADIKAIVSGGKGKMRPIANVTGASADNVVAYVKSLK